MTKITTMRDALRERILAHEKLAPAADALVEASLPGLSLRKSEETPLPYGTFLGGTPYLLAGQNWPLDAKGNPMYLVVQLNFAELHAAAVTAGTSVEDARLDNQLPTAGLLQVFLGSDSNLGYEDDGVEVRFIPEPAGGFSKADGVAAQPFEVAEDADFDSPFMDPLGEVMLNPAAVKAELALILVGLESAFDDGLLSVDEDDEDAEEEFYEAYEEFYFDARDEAPFFIGGTPGYTQNPFFPEDSFHLLQLDSDGTENIGTEMMWGDCGIAHLFVTNSTLAKMRDGEAFTLRSGDEGQMDGAIWYWDCC